MLNEIAKAARAAAALLLAAACAPLGPCTAFAQPRDGGCLVEEHAYMKSEGDGQEIPETVTEDGVVYELESLEEEADPNWEPETAHFERSKTVECAPQDLEAAVSAFPSTWKIEEEGFSGEIPLAYVAEPVPIQTQRSFPAEVKVSYEGLPSNDVAQLPETHDCEVGEGVSCTLSRAGVSWEAEGYDALGMPSSYTAVVLYRGSYEDSVVDRYSVTTYYSGDIAGGDDERMIVTAVYRPVEEPASEKEPEPGPPAEGPEAQEAFPWPAIAAAAAIIAGGVIVYFRTKNVKVALDTGSSYKLVARTRAARQADGTLKVEVPSKVDSLKGDVVLLLRSDIASGSRLVAFQAGYVVYDGPATKTVKIRKASGDR